MRIAAPGLVPAGVLGIEVAGLTVLFREQLLDLPVVSLDTDAELEVFLSDGIPVLQRNLLLNAAKTNMD